MRILHIAQTIAGGVASYFNEIASFQTRMYGADAVRFLIPDGNRHHVPSIERCNIAEFSPCDRSVRGLLALGWAAYREIESFEPTIVHLHSTFAGAIARPVTLLSKQTPRVVYCAHGWVFGMEFPSWKRRLFSLVERGLVPLTDSIINVSHSDHQLAVAYGICPRKMVTIRNGIAAVLQTSSKANPPFDPSHVNLIFVGRHDRQKGLDYLLEVFCSTELPGVRLHVVGAPVIGHGTRITEASLPDNIKFYGWQSRETVSAMIAGADALVMPSRWEGLSLVALEAMRLAKPILGSRCAGLAEVIEHGRTGLQFGLDRPSELREILNDLNKQRLAEMGKAAHGEFLRLFTADRLNAELAALYHSLLDNRISTGAFKPVAPKGRLQEVWPDK
jgi:glycosyltransferase involved in cell wall biosynthesis